jgi:protein SCO1/2
MSRIVRIAVIAFAVLAGAVTAWFTTRGDEPAALAQATLFDAPRPLPDFRLVDHAGRPFDRERLRGRWHFLFFGFTHCPDVCPTTLATLAAVRSRLRDLPQSEQPRAVLVSVDPERDTAEALAQYVPHFDPEFVGVTGDPAAIAALAQELGVAIMIGAPAADGGYTVDHTAALFLVDPDGAWTAVFGTPHAADTIASDFRAIAAAR